MSRDEAIKYNSLYQEVSLAISNIKNLGFDASEFENSLKNIHNEVNNNVKVNYVKGMAEASYVQSYATGINELNKLKIKLDNYDVYASAYNTCNYINMVLNNEISQRELEKCISKIIATLKGINKSRTIDYDNEKHIVEKIYETAYNVIKLEIVMTGDSQLYQFVKNEDTNISYFNNLIIRDIETIDLQDDTNKNIKTKMYELGQNGVYSNYLDLEFIKLILLSNGNLDIKKAITDNLGNICDELQDNIKNVKARFSDIVKKNNTVDVKNGILVDKIKKAKKRIVSAILTVALVATGGVGISKWAKKISNEGGYVKYTEIMTSDGAKYDNKDSESVTEYKDATVTVKVSQKEGDEYKYQEYDISNVEANGISGYYNYAMDNYGVENGSLEVKMDSYILKKPLDETVIMLYGIYIILIALLDVLSCNMGPFSQDYHNIDLFLHDYIKIKRMIYDHKVIKEYKQELAEETKELNDLYDEMTGYINKDTVLRDRFNTLYEENKFLLDNPEDLYQRINNLEDMNYIKEGKKLIKEKK